MFYMHKFRLIAILALSLASFLPAPVATASNVEALRALADAERAALAGDYTGTVAGYVAAAEAGAGLEIARQATLTAFDFGFDVQARKAAARWAGLAKDASEANIYAAMAALRAGDVDRATREYMALLKASPEAERKLCELADERLDTGTRVEHYSAVFAALAKSFKEAACIQRLAATGAIALEEYGRADKLLDALKRSGNFDDEARLLAISRYVREDAPDKAFADDALQLSADATIEQRTELALLNANAGDTESAIAMLQQLQDEAPQDADVLEALALAYLQSGDNEAARESFFLAAPLWPQHGQRCVLSWPVRRRRTAGRTGGPTVFAGGQRHAGPGRPAARCLYPAYS